MIPIRRACAICVYDECALMAAESFFGRAIVGEVVVNITKWLVKFFCCSMCVLRAKNRSLNFAWLVLTLSNNDFNEERLW